MYLSTFSKFTSINRGCPYTSCSYLFTRGKCKTWTLDSGLDSWTGLWTEIIGLDFGLMLNCHFQQKNSLGGHRLWIECTNELLVSM